MPSSRPISRLPGWLTSGTAR